VIKTDRLWSLASRQSKVTKTCCYRARLVGGGILHQKLPYMLAGGRISGFGATIDQ